MRTINEIFETSIDRPLYHYTGIGSLIGIAENNALWASSVSFLNDSKEMIHACETVENYLLTRLAFGPKSEELEFLNQFNTWIKSCSKAEHTIFIFSLSERSSLLSQWRSYTPHGKGVSLEFSAEKLLYIANSSNMRIARCIYTDSEQEEVVGALVDKLLSDFRQQLPDMDVSNKPPSQSYYGFINQYSSDIFQILAMIKHGAFSEECEWRLISPHYSNFKNSILKFREGASMLIPYIEIPLGAKPYFSNIILGPSQHRKLAFSGLSMYMSNKNISSMLSNSGIPYREW